ncbi:unnamed protein product [Notodromas monacha]|uniref:Peptidase M14 domain-containing protein n=1 Tax=Notodromas monacha TaxID=399045 RepID=A0A7R9BRP9_9CRUS|nr:unnamed protein product [Notodromas monacha]CAG0918943.1 unnamed protein product [Notodromas monacha]
MVLRFLCLLLLVNLSNNAPVPEPQSADEQQQTKDPIFRTALINQSFKGYKLIRALPDDQEKLKVLRALVLDPSLDFWTFPAGILIPVDVLSPPENLQALEETLKRNDISYRFIMEDLDNEIDRTMSTDSARSPIADFTFSEYHGTKVIYRQLDDWADRYKDLVSISSIGKSSHDQQDIRLLTISDPSIGSAQKPAIFIDGGIHAREWISPATVMYIARQLLSAKDNPDTRFLLEYFDWHIVPVLNPDGYDFSHAGRLNRLWRKNRSNAPSTTGIFGRRITLLTDQLSRHICPGVDLNRNFEYFWKSGGSSDWACSEVYAGPAAGSESETKALSSYLLLNKDKFKSYLTFHSYGRAILLPWGHTTDLPATYNELLRMGMQKFSPLCWRANQLLRQSIVQICYIIHANLFYIASGGSDDFAHGTAGIPYAYTIELPDQGTHGFLLPPSEIPNVGKETFAGIVAYAAELAKTLNLSQKQRGGEDETSKDKKDAVNSVLPAEVIKIGVEVASTTLASVAQVEQ